MQTLAPLEFLYRDALKKELGWIKPLTTQEMRYSSLSRRVPTLSPLPFHTREYPHRFFMQRCNGAIKLWLEIENHKSSKNI
jgi:hypothetical protein